MGVGEIQTFTALLDRVAKHQPTWSYGEKTLKVARETEGSEGCTVGAVTVCTGQIQDAQALAGAGGHAGGSGTDPGVRSQAEEKLPTTSVLLGRLASPTTPLPCTPHAPSRSENKVFSWKL